MNNPPIYVVLTSYPPRIGNVPRVLDTIRAQSVKPDGIILILAEEDRDLQKVVQNYADCIVYFVEENTKAWKKFLPAFPIIPDDALIVTIDDDRLYERGMIEEMLEVHKQFPDAPISGNHYSFRGLKCHCGNASMVQKKHFAGWEQYYHLWEAAPSIDIFCTMLAHKNGFDYVQTPRDWEHTTPIYNEGKSFSWRGMVPKSWDIIEKAFNS